MTPPIILLLVTASVAWLLLIGILHPPTVLAVAFATSIAGQSQFGVALGFLPQVALGLVVLAAFLARGDGRPESGSRIDLLLLGTLVVMLSVSLVATSSISTTASALVGAAAVFVCGATLGRRLGADEVFDQLFRASLAFLVVSVAAFPLSSAFEGGRMRGVLDNANMLGAVAALAAGSAPRRSKWPVTVAAAVVIWFSGSRASAVALVLILLIRLEWRPGTRFGAALLGSVLVLLGALGLWAYDSSVPADETVVILDADNVAGTGSIADQGALLRTRDNRTVQWRQGIDDTLDNLPLGTGFGTAAFEYSNSVLFLSVETGLLAIPVFALVLLVLGLATRHADRRVAAVSLAFLGHSMFEGWLFAFGSALAVTFWIIVAAGIASSAGHLRRDSEQDSMPTSEPGFPQVPTDLDSMVRLGYFESRNPS